MKWLDRLTLSFKGAIQTLEAFQPLIAQIGPRSRSRRKRIYHEWRDAIAAHRVTDQPERFEPHGKKKHKAP